MLNINTKAPNFTLYDQNNKQVSLSDFLGKKVILYFYPKDDTPGCTSQACSFNDLSEDFKNANAVIIGISKDSVASHKKFMEKYLLNFILLSDSDLTAIKEYDVWHERVNYGKKYMGVVRTTYIIDENGIITHAFEKVNATKNPSEMLKLITNS